MAPTKTATKTTHKRANRTSANDTASKGFSAEEKAAARERVRYLQNAGKFKVRYQTLGFSDKAKIDDGAMWPIQYALTELTATEEAKITALVKKAVR
jgi:hypothetical protein